MAIQDLTTYTEVDSIGFTISNIEHSNNVEFYYEGVKALETTTNGIEFYETKIDTTHEYMKMLKEMMDEVQELTMVKNDWGVIRDGFERKQKKEVEWFTDEDFLI